MAVVARQPSGSIARRRSRHDRLACGGKNALGSSGGAVRSRNPVARGCGLAVALSLGAARHEPGFRTASVLTMRVNVSRTKYAQRPQLKQFYAQLLQRVRASPGVRGAAIISAL